MRATLAVWTAVLSLTLPGIALASTDTPVRAPGRCAMYGECGSKGAFGGQIPCPDNELARQESDPLFIATLASVCGVDFSTDGLVCCTQGQLATLSTSLQQAEPLIATCPACKNNFINYYCHFTCSPDQSTFLQVTQTQPLKDDKLGVREVEVDVGTEFGNGFFSSCKDVKFGATNGYAMDLLGGGAKDYMSFLRYMGKERALGSPFQITYPETPSGNLTLSPTPLSCASSELNARCACPDCPGVCATLPPVASPAEIYEQRCRVGKMSCFSFMLCILYAVALVGSAIFLLFTSAFTSSLPTSLSLKWSSTRSPPSAQGYDRVPLSDPQQSGDSEASPRSNVGNRSSVVGAPATANAQDGESSSSRRQRSSLASSSDGPNTPDGAFLQPRSYPLNTSISTYFYSLGLFCATRPFLTLAIASAVCGLLNAGWSRFAVERDPVNLWVSPASELALQKKTFDTAFGPFYRTEQIFLTLAPPPRVDLGEGEEEEAYRWAPVDEPVLSWPVLQFWAGVEKDIRGLISRNGILLSDLCLSPAEGTCVVQSPLGYFQDSLDHVSESTWAPTLDACVDSPASCLPSFGMPLTPALVLGGIPESGAAHDARALIVTYVLRNSLDPVAIADAEEWETTLRNYLGGLEGRAREAGLQISYSTGISLEEELNKSTNTDVKVVVASYLLMLAYVAIGLGSSGAGLAKGAARGVAYILNGLVWAVKKAATKVGGERGRARSNSLTLSMAGSTSAMGAYFRRQILVDSKFVLGLWGIIIVLLSVSTSIGLFSLIGVKVTLIIAEVIPFLVLAIGVDNIFLLSHALDQQNARAYATAARFADDELDLPPAEERVARALAQMGPSVLLSAACQTVAFSLGALVGMPAVRNFAIYAAGAVVINALLQITTFVAVMAIDLRRVESNRVDCFPCFKLPTSSSLELGSSVSEGFIARFIRTVYAPSLLKKRMKYLVLALFSGFFVLSWIGARHIELGLDQRLALPHDSYLVNYFNSVDAYLDVGPPVYFVTKGIDPTQRPAQQKLCGRFSTCDELSLANVLEAERKRPDSSFIAEPPAVWIDDFLQWLNPLLEDCCRVKRREPTVFCTPEDSEIACRPCYEDAEPAWNITMSGFPEGPDFMRYLQHWLTSPTDESCPLGGKASYADALKLDDSGVAYSHFRTYHTPLKTQADFINAMDAAQRVAHDLSKRSGASVFPYSLFYVFFEQYAHIVATTREVLTLALTAIFLVTALLLGSWRTAAVVLVTVFMTVVSVMGTMGVWGISLNGISLVNLVISCGIAVEFCSHVARAFMGACGGGLPFNHPAGTRDRDERAYASLVEVGASVISGITLTKLFGISVLALTRSKILEVYFFRMWLVLILSGALHGLVLLPVLLSFFGGQGYALSTDDDAWMGRVMGSRYEGRIFLGDDDDSDSGASEF